MQKLNYKKLQKLPPQKFILQDMVDSWKLQSNFE